MSGQARPWWASEGPVDGGISPDEDPMERFRSARRGGGADDAGDRPAHEPAAAEDEGTDDAAHAGQRSAAEPWLAAAAATMSRLARDLADGAHAPTSPTGTDRPVGDAATGDAATRDAATRDAATGDVREEAIPDGDGGDGGSGSAAGSDAGGHASAVCGVCPICVGARALGEARPELLGHLAQAARHVALAARALTEHPEGGDRGERGEAHRRPGDEDGPLEHIDLD